MKPENILSNLNLQENMIACEFGCGAGALTIALAKRLKNGRVFGLDVQEEKLSALQSRASSLENLKNVFTVRCDLEKPGDSTLRKNFVDLVLIPNVLYQAENKCGIIKEGSRILKRRGQLLIVDWIENPFKKHQKHVAGLEEVKNLAGKAELILKREFQASDNHYALLFTK